MRLTYRLVERLSAVGCRHLAVRLRLTALSGGLFAQTELGGNGGNALRLALHVTGFASPQ